MPIDTLRMIFGFTIILSHLASFGLILLGGTLTSSERTELSMIIAPVFALYVTAIVRKIMTMDKFDKTPVHPALATLGTGIALIFGVAIPVVILSFEAGRIENFAGLKSTIAIVETALGLYTGAIVDRLFGGTDKPSAGGPAVDAMRNEAGGSV